MFCLSEEGFKKNIMLWEKSCLMFFLDLGKDFDKVPMKLLT